MSVRSFEGSTHAQLYARFRPIYPDSVVEEILDFLKEKIPSNEWQTAVDVGCGSGQGTNRLAAYFQKCYGFDVSPAQISEAKESKHFDNVFYDVFPAECLPTIATNSVQLVTAFAAAHWFDLPKFFKEIDRVLVDNGVVALACYHMPGPDPIDSEAPDDQRLIKLMKDIWFDQRLAPFKSPKIKIAENHYKDIQFPEKYDQKLKDGFIDTKTVLAQDLVGFCKSWSLYQGLVAKDKQLADQCLKEFTDKLKTIVNTNDLTSKQISTNFKFFIAMARKNKAW